MPQTAEPREIVLRQSCPACGRSLPYTLEHFFFCLLCGKVVCRRCMMTCLLCQRERCALCVEKITAEHKTSGLICEKCATFLNPKKKEDK